MCPQFFRQFSSHMLFLQIFSTLNKILYNDYTPTGRKSVKNILDLKVDGTLSLLYNDYTPSIIVRLFSDIKCINNDYNMVSLVARLRMPRKVANR